MRRAETTGEFGRKFAVSLGLLAQKVKLVLLVAGIVSSKGEEGAAW